MSKSIHDSKSEVLSLFLSSVIFLIAANLITINFITRENYLYFWDFSAYWKKVVHFTEHFVANPYVAIRFELFDSVRGDDYNLFPALLLLPVTIFAGASRLVYILSVVDVFAFGAVISFALLHIRLIKIYGEVSVRAPLVAVGVVLLSPNFWSPIFYGYLDVGGLVIINLILLLFVTANPESNELKSILVALLIPMAILFRRWYGFWALSFYAVCFVDQCVSLFLERSIKGFTKMLARLGTQMSISILLLVIAAPVFVVKAAATSYTDRFSPYRFSNSLFESAAKVVDEFGLLVMLLFLAGAVQLIVRKTTRRFAILLLLQWVVIFYLFSRTQDFGPQHFYLLLPAILVFSAVFMTNLFARLGILSGCCVVLLLAMNFASAFSSEDLWYKKLSGHLFTNIRHPPLIRNDLKEIDRMLDVLEQTLTRPDDRVYILASSLVLNSSMLDSAYLSLNRHHNVSRLILRTHDVDKKDGFPRALLTAQYVVVADPVQYHLAARDQRVVGIPAELILAGRNMGTAFVKLPDEFVLDGGVRCYLYKKVREFDQSDLMELSQRFKNHYPNRPNIYKINDN